MTGAFQYFMIRKTANQVLFPVWAREIDGDLVLKDKVMPSQRRQRQVNINF